MMKRQMKCVEMFSPIKNDSYNLLLGIDWNVIMHDTIYGNIHYIMSVMNDPFEVLYSYNEHNINNKFKNEKEMYFLISGTVLKMICQRKKCKELFFPTYSIYKVIDISEEIITIGFPEKKELYKIYIEDLNELATIENYTQNPNFMMFSINENSKEIDLSEKKVRDDFKRYVFNLKNSFEFTPDQSNRLTASLTYESLFAIDEHAHRGAYYESLFAFYDRALPKKEFKDFLSSIKLIRRELYGIKKNKKGDLAETIIKLKKIEMGFANRVIEELYDNKL